MAQAPRPRRANSKTSKVTPAKKPSARSAVKKIPSQPKSPAPSRDFKKLLSTLRISGALRIFVLLLIVGGIFILNPQSGIIQPNTPQTTDASQTYKIDIRSRALADPREGAIKIKTGNKGLLEVTTDEDGRLDLVSDNRDVFNPIFSNVSNTLSIPTDQVESFRLEFHPASDSRTSNNAFIVGTVIVQK